MTMTLRGCCAEDGRWLTLLIESDDPHEYLRFGGSAPELLCSSDVEASFLSCVGALRRIASQNSWVREPGLLVQLTEKLEKARDVVNHRISACEGRRPESENRQRGASSNETTQTICQSRVEEEEDEREEGDARQALRLEFPDVEGVFVRASKSVVVMTSAVKASSEFRYDPHQREYIVVRLKDGASNNIERFRALVRTNALRIRYVSGVCEIEHRSMQSEVMSAVCKILAANRFRFSSVSGKKLWVRSVNKRAYMGEIGRYSVSRVKLFSLHTGESKYVLWRDDEQIEEDRRLAFNAAFDAKKNHFLSSLDASYEDTDYRKQSHLHTQAMLKAMKDSSVQQTEWSAPTLPFTTNMTNAPLES